MTSNGKYKIIISSDNLEQLEDFEKFMTTGLNTVVPYYEYKGITIENNLTGEWQ